MKRGKSFNNKGKKAQEIFGMSFSVIFSIFLIIFFIVIAFIAIKAFLSTQQCVKIGLFVKDFQAEIDKAWNSPSLTLEFKRNIGSGIQYVCFANLSKSLSSNGVEGGDGKFINKVNEEIADRIRIYDESENNMFFYPLEKACDMPANQIKHLNIGEITKTKNPYCIKTSKGEIVLEIEKELSEILVKVK